MSVRGIRCVYSNPSGPAINYAYRDSESINLATTDLTFTCWGRILGANADAVKGQIPMALSENLFDYVGQFMTTDGASPFNMRWRVIVVGTPTDIGSWSVATGETWFYAVTWNHTTGVWTAYAAKDADGSMGTPGTSGGSFATTTLTTIYAGGGPFSSFWGNNIEVTDPKLWVGVAKDATALLAEKNSDGPADATSIRANWALLSSSSLANTSGADGPLVLNGSVTDALLLDPASIAGGGGGGGDTFIEGMDGIENGIKAVTAAGMQGVLQ